MVYLLQQLFNGCVIAGIYALIGVGISLIWGLTGLINFAQGEMVMVGAFVAIASTAATGSYVLGVLTATLAVGAVGLVAERALFRWTFDRPINGFVVSLGLIVLLQTTVAETWGTGARRLRQPLTGVAEAAGIRMPTQSLFVLAFAALVIGALVLGLRWSLLGKTLRAAAEQSEAAALLGIPVRLFVVLAFTAGSAIAGLGGALYASLYPVDPYVGGTLVVQGFAVTLVGGLGSIEGAAIGALLLGLATSLFAAYVSSTWSGGVTFLAMIVVLMVRPTGLFRGTEATA